MITEKPPWGVFIKLLYCIVLYLHGPSTDKMGTGANFIHAMLQIKRSVNRPLKQGNIMLQIQWCKLDKLHCLKNKN